MMYCKYCGQQIDDDSLFCNHCGKQLAIPENVPAEPDKNMEEETVQENKDFFIPNTPAKEKTITNKPQTGKNPYIMIGIVVVAMIIVGCIINLLLPKKAAEEETVEEEVITETAEPEESAVPEEITTEEEEPEETEVSEEIPAEEEEVIDVPEQVSFAGSSFTIPFYGTDDINRDSAAMIRSFFEMKNVYLSEAALCEDLNCGNSKADRSTVASVLNRYINANRIQAIYEVTDYADETAFHEDENSIFSIVRKNVNDGYPTFFETDAAYLYGGIPHENYHYVLVKGYETDNGIITALLIDDPLQGSDIVVSYDRFVQAVIHNDVIFYIH